MLIAGVLAAGDRGPRGTPLARDVSLHVNPNIASVDDLMLLPGIGPKLAEEIVAYRSRAGGGHVFRSEADLDAVKRIGPKTIAKLRPMLSFDAPPIGEASRP